MVNKKPCMSYCSHGGVCVLYAKHKEKHNSRYCTWTTKGLTKRQADKIIIEKNGELGKFIANAESKILNKMGIKW